MNTDWDPAWDHNGYKFYCPQTQEAWGIIPTYMSYYNGVQRYRSVPLFFKLLDLV